MIAKEAAGRRELADLPVNFWLVGQEVSLTQRRGRYTPASIRHPGKMLPELARQLITAYSQPGDWVLDPMSGIGTTGVEASHLGRHYIGIELEPRFVAWQHENLSLARSQGATGTATVLQGDARRLGDGLAVRATATGDAPIDAIITSPPYGNRLTPRTGPPSRVMQDLMRQGKMGADVIPEGYGASPKNLGNLSDASYLEEMRRVYAGCFEVLKPGGILAVVIRPGRDRQRLRPLHHETARLCIGLGFEFIDERVAILSRVEASATTIQVFNHALFFKRLATAHLRRAGFPVTLEQLEYVLVFRKPLVATRTAAKAKAAFRPPLPARARPEAKAMQCDFLGRRRSLVRA